MNKRIYTQIGLLLFLIFFSSKILAQAPVISGVDKNSGSVGEVVTITGSGFGTSIGDMIVYFGAAKGGIQFADNSTIKVSVPAGATHERISVTNLRTKLTAYSSHPFMMTFGGEPGQMNFAEQVDFDVTGAGTKTDLYDLCVCDFTGDDKPDIAGANQESISFPLFTNISPIDDADLRLQAIPAGINTLNVACGDLDGNGEKDLLFSKTNKITSNENNVVLILPNIESGGTPLNLEIPDMAADDTDNVDVGRMAIGDLDLDGKPEIIVVNSVKQKSEIIVFRNTSSTTTLAFDAPVRIPFLTAGDASAFDIAIEDLNNDGRPEVIAINGDGTNTDPNIPKVLILNNESSVGNIQLTAPLGLKYRGANRVVKVGDLNGDGKSDIIVTNFNQKPSVYLNESMDKGRVAFPENPIVLNDVAKTLNAWGLDLGDMDGDGKLDLVIAYTQGDEIRILRNTTDFSSPTTLSFDEEVIDINENTRNVRVVDVNGDSKPDIVFNKRDAGGSDLVASRVSVLLNISCIKPAFQQENPLNSCTGGVTISVGESAGITSYVWKDESGNIVKDGADNTLDVGIGTFKYTVTAIGPKLKDGAECNLTSEQITITTSEGSVPSVFEASSNSPVCESSVLRLEATSIPSGSYKWILPDGTEQISTSNILEINNFTPELAGTYKVELLLGGGTCKVAENITVVTAATVAPIRIVSSFGDLLCNGKNSTTLSVAPGLESYQWFLNGEAILGATGARLEDVSVAGNYTVEVRPAPECDPIISPIQNINVVDPPATDFSFSPDRACIDTEVQFMSNSSGAAGQDLSFDWNFGDGRNSTEENPIHSFVSIQDFIVNLKVGYADLTSCSAEISKTITIEDGGPDVTISMDKPGLLCPEEVRTLTVDGDFANYFWNNGAMGKSIKIDSAFTYKVTVTTESGCEVTSNSIFVGNFPTIRIRLTATPPTIDLGESTELIVGGLRDVSWEPTDGLSAPNDAVTTATPTAETTYTATGTDDNGCIVSESIFIDVIGGRVTELLNPKNIFSPNGDRNNDLWQIKDIEKFPQCAVTVYDKKGIKVFEAQPYNNDWDGSVNGKQLPNGVYFYIITCEGDDNATKGSLTVIR